MYILSKTEMYEADRYTIENIGISGHTLMECAGQEMAKEIENYIITHNPQPSNLYNVNYM